MNNFFFRNPTKMLFGKGMLKNLGNELKHYGKNTLIVYGGRNIKKIGLLNQVRKILSNHNISFFELSGVVPNPVISKVKKGIVLVKKHRIKTILAIGGGSVIDTGKIIAAGAMVKHDPWDFFTGKERVDKGLPLITIQTLSGSAAEVTSGATITNEKTKQKFGAGGYALYPKVSILDPKLTFSAPKTHTAYGAVDMLSYILDPYFFGKKEKTFVPDSMSEALAKIIIKTTPKVILNPNNYELRANMMWAASLANYGMISRGLNPARYYLHMIEHSISGLHDIPHGAGLSVLIVGWTKYAKKYIPFKLSQFGKKVFDLNYKTSLSASASKTAKKIEKWLNSIKCPTKLSQLNISEDEFTKIIKNILYEIDNELRYMDNKSLKKFASQHYPEKKNLDNISKIKKFEEKRLFQILNLCK